MLLFREIEVAHFILVFLNGRPMVNLHVCFNSAKIARSSFRVKVSTYSRHREFRRNL